MTVHSETERFEYDNGASIEVTTDSEDDFNARVKTPEGEVKNLRASDLMEIVSDE